MTLLDRLIRFLEELCGVADGRAWDARQHLAATDSAILLTESPTQIWELLVRIKQYG